MASPMAQVVVTSAPTETFCLLDEVEALMARHCSEVHACMRQWRERQTSWNNTQHAPGGSRSGTKAGTKHELLLNALPEEPNKPRSRVALCARLQDENDSVYDERRPPTFPGPFVDLAAQSVVRNERPVKAVASPARALFDDHETDPACVIGFDMAPEAKPSKAAANPDGFVLEENDEASDIGFDVGKDSVWEHRASLVSSVQNIDKNAKSRMMRIVSCPLYDQLNFAVVLANTIFVGVQTQYMANAAVNAVQRGRGGFPVEQASHQVLHGLFTAIFAIDLALRWTAHGFMQFLRDSDVAWNLLDIFIVVLGIFDLLFFVFAMQNAAVRESTLGHVSVIRVLRIVRLVRVSRAVKILKVLRDLRVMVASIVGSLKSLLWVFVVIFGVVYIFGIVMTVGITNYITQPIETGGDDIPDVIRYFGSLDASMLSLFMAMSGGADWREFYDVLVRVDSLRYIFLIFILFSLFAVVNIVTGIFVENAVHISRSDSSLLIQEQIDSMRARTAGLQSLYLALDMDGTGCLSRDGFKSRIKNGGVAAAFAALDFPISSHDASLLFDVLDKDGSQELSVREFVNGCYCLLGRATNFDTKMIRIGMESLQKSMNHLEHQMLGEHAEHEHSDHVPSCKRVVEASRRRPGKVNV